MAVANRKPRAPRKTKPVAAVAAELGDFEQAETSASNDADVLRIEYVPVQTVALWEKNPKKHDAGAIINSFKKHGFKDPPKWEPTLNSGRGGIVEGNGRSHHLREMELAKEPAPRGIKVSGDGTWYMPILYGVDSESERAAEGYGIDHNNITLLGGDFDDFDISKLYDSKAYTEMLADMAQFEALPVSVDGDDVDALIERMSKEGQPKSSSGSGSAGTGSSSAEMTSFEQSQHIVKDGGAASKFCVVIDCEDEGEQHTIYDALKDGYENIRMISS